MNRFVSGFADKIYEFSIFLLSCFVGYFEPLKNIVHLVLFMFFLDIIYGWLADKKLTRAKFKPSLVWSKTMPRVLLSLILLIAAYVIDKETGQQWVNTYSILGWGISGLLFLSIAKNGYIVTKWKSIPILEKWVEDKIERETGIKINNEIK